MVAGSRPYEIASSSAEEISRIICHTQPRRPSDVARARGISVDRDLDHVILRAMAKPANDRYASCSQFADDLSRYLAGQPVSATHAGWSYRRAKFIKALSCRRRVGDTILPDGSRSDAPSVRSRNSE